MSIFKKTIKYSKDSGDLNKKIKGLNEDLKKTGVIPEGTEPESFLVENKQEDIPKIADKLEIVKEENQFYNWRESFVEKEDIKENTSQEIYQSYNLSRVENYISEGNKDLIILRDQIFKEISEETLLDLPEIKSKISRVLEIYDEIKEGLLREPPEVQNSDPLTPLNQNFVTIDELNRHYTLFVNRVQEQLGTIGGGGEYRFKYLDGIVGIKTNSSNYNGKFLQWNSTTNQAEFVTVTGNVGGGSSGVNVKNLGSVVGFAGTIDFGTNLSVTSVSAGVVTVTASISGIASYASSAGVSTNVKGTGGRVLYNSSTDTTTTSSNLTFDGTTLSVNSTPGSNTSSLYLTGTPFAGNTKNGLFGIGQLGFNDSNIIANLTGNVNSYSQVILQNLSTGNAASADFIVNSDSPLGQTYYGDFGINGTGYAGGGPFGDVSGTYLYSAGGTLSVGTNDAYDFRIATGSAYATPVTRVTVSAVSGNVGIGSTVPTSKLTVQGGDIRVGVDTSQGVILTSPNGTKYRLFVQNDGTLKTVAV